MGAVKSGLTNHADLGAALVQKHFPHHTGSARASSPFRLCGTRAALTNHIIELMFQTRELGQPPHVERLVM